MREVIIGNNNHIVVVIVIVIVIVIYYDLRHQFSTVCSPTYQPIINHSFRYPKGRSPIRCILGPGLPGRLSPPVLHTACFIPLAAPLLHPNPALFHLSLSMSTIITPVDRRLTIVTNDSYHFHQQLQIRVGLYAFPAPTLPYLT